MDWNDDEKDSCQGNCQQDDPGNGQADDQKPVRSMEAESPPAEDGIPELILLRAENIVFGYQHNLRRCAELREELDNLPLYTWLDAFEVLSGHGAPDSERVQTSNIPDPTFKITANIDRKLASMNRDLVREVEDELRRAISAVDVMDTVLIRLELLKHEQDYRNTIHVARQICIEGRKAEAIKDRDGWRMRKKTVCEEVKKIVRLTAEELMRREMRWDE